MFDDVKYMSKILEGAVMSAFLITVETDVQARSPKVNFYSRIVKQKSRRIQDDKNLFSSIQS